MWDVFKRKFKTAFNPVDTKGGAMLKLANWRQRSGTTASNHVAKMNTYISRAEIHEDEVKMTFLIGSLESSLQNGLFISGLSTTATYSDLCDNLLTQDIRKNS